MSERPIVVFDIDGVLADATHRQHLVEVRPKDWDGFFAAVGGDAVIDEGRQKLLDLASQAQIVLVSGRPERTRADTEQWLESSGMGGFRLILRPDSDRRPAAALKSDLIRALGGPEEITLVVDDDATVIGRLTAMGYRASLFPEGDPLA